MAGDCRPDPAPDRRRPPGGPCRATRRTAMNPATTVTGVLASLRARAAAGPWRRVLGTDWVLLALIVLVYSQFPDRLRLFDADPLVAFVAVALTLRRLLLGRRNGDLW